MTPVRSAGDGPATLEARREAVLPGSPSPDGADRPLKVRTMMPGDVVEVAASAASAVALAWLLFSRLTPLRGAFGFVIATFALFVPIYWVVCRDRHGPLAASDRVATALMVTAGAATFVPLVLIVGYVVDRGAANLRPGFFTETLEVVGPLDPPTAGGALHALVGTAQQVGIALAVSVPLAVLTAVYLSEIGGRPARWVRFLVDAMSGVPSIVAGLFVYAVWVLQFGQGFSGLAAGLALSILMLPTVARTAEVMLRLVPSGVREGALALGAPEWRVALQVVLPTARAGLVTAVILGVARVVGETAPVLLTAFGSSSLNSSPVSGPQEDLVLFIYRNIRASVDAPVERAWTAAFVLITLVLVLFALARFLGGSTFRRRLGGRQGA